MKLKVLIKKVKEIKNFFKFSTKKFGSEKDIISLRPSKSLRFFLSDYTY